LFQKRIRSLTMTICFFYFLAFSIIDVYGQNQAPVADSDTWDFTYEWGERGYIPVYNDERALFYWAWESQFRFNDDLEPPLTLWLSGPDGYGVSSIRDMFFANGPYKILEFPGPYGTDTLKMTLNPFKLNSLSNMVWVDQPAGAGYSYSNTSVAVDTFEDAAEDLCEFLAKFLGKYPKFLNGEFYLAGDGDAATILLALSDKLIDANIENLASTCPKVNYRGMMLSGPVVDIESHWSGILKTAKEEEVFDSSVVQAMEERLKLCIDLYRSCSEISPKNGGDESTPEWSGCMLNFMDCKDNLISPSELKADGLVFDEFNIMNSDCRLGEDLYTNYKCNQDFLTGLDRWLKEDDVLSAYGVPMFTSGFSMYNTTVANNFLASGARHSSYISCLKKALDAGLRVLIWTGEFDYFGSVYGLKFVLNKTEGYEDILNQKEQMWTSTDGAEVIYKTHKDLVFAIVQHAGHHLSFDFPRATQLFFVEWIYGMKGMSLRTDLMPNTVALAVDTESSLSSENQNLSILYGAIIGALGTIIVGLLAWCFKSKLLSKVYNESQNEKSYSTTDGETAHKIGNINISLR